jgi:putative ABC transport system ATP-binding protein
MSNTDKKLIYKLVAVGKTYKQKRGIVKALDEVSLEITAGDMVSIQGPTGGGKSTLLQLLGALDRPSSGTIEIDGAELENLGDNELADLRAEKIGFVFQSFNLIPTLTASENVETALVPSGLSAAARKEKVQAALESVGLGDRGSHLPSELSGGQQQRVAIARAIVKSPTVLLADEPTGNLDEQTRDEIVSVLEALWREKGITLIMVTHDSAVARRANTHLKIAGGKVTISKSAK